VEVLDPKSRNGQLFVDVAPHRSRPWRDRDQDLKQVDRPLGRDGQAYFTQPLMASLKTLGRSHALAVDIPDAMTGHARKTEEYGVVLPAAMMRELSKIQSLERIKTLEAHRPADLRLFAGLGKRHGMKRTKTHIPQLAIGAIGGDWKSPAHGQSDAIEPKLKPSIPHRSALRCSLFLSRSTPCAWSYTNNAGEVTREMRVVAEAALHGHIGERQPVIEQLFLGQHDALLN
jgi:hypothetical protein